MKRLKVSLSLTSVVVVLGGGVLALCATGLLGIARFMAVPDALGHSFVVDAAQGDFLASLALVGTVFLAHYEPRLRDNERRTDERLPVRGGPMG